MVRLLFSDLASAMPAQEEQAADELVIAVLDSGCDTKHPAFAEYRIECIDLTGEGPQDDNGHGTGVMGIALDGLPPTMVRVLSIKILDKHLKTDAVRILLGLREAADRGATVVNLSSGVWLTPEEAVPYCRKLAQFWRRNPQILLITAAGNEGVDLDQAENILFPQTAEKVSIPLEQTQFDLFEDCAYFLEQAREREANEHLMMLIGSEPPRELEDKAFLLRRGMVYNVFALAGLRGEDEAAATRFRAKAAACLSEFLDVPKMFENLVKQDAEARVLAQQAEKQQRLERLEQAGAYRAAGIHHKNAQRFQEAADMHEQALALHRELNADREVVRDLGNLGVTYLNLRDWGRAELYLEEADELGRSLLMDREVAISCMNLAIIKKLTKDYENAAHWIAEAREHAESASDDNLLDAIDVWRKDLARVIEETDKEKKP